MNQRGIQLSLVSAMLLVVGPIGTRLGVWSFRVGFAVVAMSLLSGVVGAGLSLASGLKTQRWAQALAGIASGLLAVAAIGVAMLGARGAPPIHDITTDTNDPPAFVAIASLRTESAGRAGYGGVVVAEQQRRAYPDIEPLTLSLAAPMAFARALTVARDLGWEVVGQAEAEGRIEAIATTLWFGFKDDVVIRLRGSSDGTRVDIRSKSRVGRGDLGTNARRVRAFLAAMRSAS